MYVVSKSEIATDRATPVERNGRIPWAMDWEKEGEVKLAMQWNGAEISDDRFRFTKRFKCHGHTLN